MLYRIVANSRRKGDIVALAMKRFKAFDVWEGATYRNGVKEYAVVLEVSSEDANADIDVRTVAHDIQALGRPVEVQVLESKVLKPLARITPTVEQTGDNGSRAEKSEVPFAPVIQGAKEPPKKEGGSGGRTGKSEEAPKEEEPKKEAKEGSVEGIQGGEEKKSA